MSPAPSIRAQVRTARRSDARPAGPSDLGALDAAIRHLDLAEQRLRPVEMAIALLEVGHCHRRHDSVDAAEWYLQRGLGWARTLGASHLTIEILCELAATCATMAEQLEPVDPRQAYSARERARDHGFEATTLASRASDPRFEALVLGRVSEALESCGDTEDSAALRLRQAALIATLAA